MSCVNRIRYGILATLLTTFLLGIVQHESMADGGGFTLCAYPFPDSVFYNVHMVSYESGTLAALCSPRASYVPGRSTVVKFILVMALSRCSLHLWLSSRFHSNCSQTIEF